MPPRNTTNPWSDAERARRSQRLHNDVVAAVKRHAVTGVGGAMPGAVVRLVDPIVLAGGIGAGIARVLAAMDDVAFDAALHGIVTAASHFKGAVRADLDDAARHAGAAGQA